ncbi:hypothetical protein SRABI106_01399 [Rahnella aquatilis]|nr:hypothetical protein SRABI106_01399 [Rahnella aquatilis]
MIFNRPRQQGFVSAASKCAGDNVNLISRSHTQTGFFHHRQIQLFHQLVNQAAATVNNNQRAVIFLTISHYRHEQALERFFIVQQHTT